MSLISASTEASLRPKLFKKSRAKIQNIGCIYLANYELPKHQKSQ